MFRVTRTRLITAKNGTNMKYRYLDKMKDALIMYQLLNGCKGKTKNGSRCKHMTDNSNQLCGQHQNQE